VASSGRSKERDTRYAENVQVENDFNSLHWSGGCLAAFNCTDAEGAGGGLHEVRL
jgi:hypothetical protein